MIKPHPSEAGNNRRPLLLRGKEGEAHRDYCQESHPWDCHLSAQPSSAVVGVRHSSILHPGKAIPGSRRQTLPWGRPFLPRSQALMFHSDAHHHDEPLCACHHRGRNFIPKGGWREKGQLSGRLPFMRGSARRGHPRLSGCR